MANKKSNKKRPQLRIGKTKNVKVKLEMVITITMPEDADVFDTVTEVTNEMDYHFDSLTMDIPIVDEEFRDAEVISVNTDPIFMGRA